MKKTVGMVSLGCPKNQVDGEILLASLEQHGYNIVENLDNAEIVVINTCGFIEDAKKESIDSILEFVTLKEEGRVKKIVVTGCLAQRYQQEIEREIPEVDVVLGIGSNKNIVDAINKSIKDNENVYSFLDKYNLPLEGKRKLLGPTYSAYLKIAEGCSNGCTYCAIPLIRGKFRSRQMEDIVDEANKLADGGVKEIVLVAQDTSRYGEDLYGKSYLPELLEELSKIEKLSWIRILYCYPERIDNRLLKVISENEKIVKYLDIPIQHSNKRILGLMNRKGDKKSLTNLIFNIRKKVPGITLRTSLIAGFPTETNEEFEELAEFVKQIKFDRLGCFSYSQEEDTLAAKMDGQIDEKTKTRRAEIITEMQYDININKNKKLIGQKIDVLVEGYDHNIKKYYGRSESDAPDIDFKVFIDSKKDLSTGAFVEVKITDLMELDLLGIFK